MLKRKEKGIRRNKNNRLKNNSQTFVSFRKIWSMSWVCLWNWPLRTLWNLWISLVSMAGLARSLLIGEILQLALLLTLLRLLPRILAFILLFRGACTSNHAELARHGCKGEALTRATINWRIVSFNKSPTTKLTCKKLIVRGCDAHILKRSESDMHQSQISNNQTLNMQKLCQRLCQRLWIADAMEISTCILATRTVINQPITNFI